MSHDRQNKDKGYMAGDSNQEPSWARHGDRLGEEQENGGDWGKLKRPSEDT